MHATRTKKSSLNARETAKDVAELIRKGQRVNLGEIIRKRYSEVVSKSPTIVTNTKSYQDEMRPIVEQLEEERQRAIAMLKKKISKAKYRDLTDGVDKLTKNIQLLSGKATENVKIGGLIDELDA